MNKRTAKTFLNMKEEACKGRSRLEQQVRGDVTQKEGRNGAFRGRKGAFFLRQEGLFSRLCERA
jgi:hypothetical protein